MRSLRIVLICIVMISAALCAQSAFAEEEMPAQQPQDAENDLQWVWGEVSAVDTARQEIGIRYLDYETDNEKEMTLTIDSDTILENAQALSDIKVQDTLSVDYLAAPDGKNLAKTISLEKYEELPADIDESGQLKEEMPLPEDDAATMAPAVDDKAVLE